MRMRKTVCEKELSTRKRFIILFIYFLDVITGLTRQNILSEGQWD